MDSIRRKIELQSLDDLKFLIDNVNQAARERINSHLPEDGTTRTEADAQADVRKRDEVEPVIRAVSHTLLSLPPII